MQLSPLQNVHGMFEAGYIVATGCYWLSTVFDIHRHSNTGSAWHSREGAQQVASS